jgi:hypothetical protein
MPPATPNPPQPPTAGVEAPGGQVCAAASLQSLVGQNREILTRTRFSGPVRIEEPGMAYTMDYREDRLRIVLDDHGKIISVLCG